MVLAAFAYLGCYPGLYVAQSPLAVALVLLGSGLMTAGAGPLAEAITLSALAGRTERYGPIRLWGSIGFILAVFGLGVWLDHHDVAGLLDILVVLAEIVLFLRLPQLLRRFTLRVPRPARGARPGALLDGDLRHGCGSRVADRRLDVGALGAAPSFAVSALFAALGGAFVLWRVRV